jgi:multiple sugar transport system substrate-binding protein
MRRITSALAAASVATIVLAGCSATAPESDGPVELTLWTGFTGGDRAAYEDLIAAFNETHDDIQVTMEVQPWDTIAQKLPSAWATGQGPDLATPSFDPNVVAKYLDTNSLLKLDDVGDTSLLAPSAIDAFTVDDTLYAVPANVATLQLYYNKSLFAAAGIEQPPATVEEFKADAAALSGDGVVGLSLADHETIQMWPILQWLEGGDIVDADGCSVLDDPKNVAGLQSWVDLVTAGAAPVGLTGAESDSLFSAGKAAMQLNGPWAAAGYTEAGIDFGVVPVPVGVDRR